MAAKTRLLCVDAPNIDMRLGALLGRAPVREDRPDMGALTKWFCERGDQGDVLDARVFVNITEEGQSRLVPWFRYLTGLGWSVFVKPKAGTSDVDPDMLSHIRAAADAGELKEVVVASCDAKNFAEPLEELAARGISVVSLGFSEFAGKLVSTPGIRFIELDSIPRLFNYLIPRRTLHSLPVTGRLLAPRQTLRATPVNAATN